MSSANVFAQPSDERPSRLSQRGVPRQRSAVPVDDEPAPVDRALMRNVTCDQTPPNGQERQQLQATLAGMEDMLTAIAHDLRIPLASLRMTAEILLTDHVTDTAQVRRLLQTIHNEALRMSAMVDDVLECARLESGVACWSWNDIHAGEVCSDALEAVVPWAHGKEIELLSSVDPPDLRFNGDASAVRRLLVNLLTNAIKHTSRGTITLTATEQHREGQRWAVLEVRDTGAGIPRHVACKLGQAFAANTGVVGLDLVQGAGLGLAICKHITAAHGGFLMVESAQGQGSTFTAHLQADLSRPVETADQNSSLGRAAA